MFRLRSRDNRFITKAQKVLEGVHEQLAAAREQQAEAERRLDAAALTAALSPDPFAAAPLLAAANAARERTKLLETALASAEALERQHKAARAAEIVRSINASRRTHIGNFVRHVGNFSMHAAAMVSSFDGIMETAGKITTSLPEDAKKNWSILNYGQMLRYCQDELNRLGRGAANAVVGQRDPAPGCLAKGTIALHAFSPHNLKPLAEFMEERLLRLHAVIVGNEAPIEPTELPTVPPADMASTIDPTEGLDDTPPETTAQENLT